MYNTLIFIVTFFGMALSQNIFAGVLNVYETPVENSKVIATMRNGDQIIPIFYHDKKEWVKVAIAKTGEVGWVKAKEVKGPIIVTKVNGSEIRQQIITDTDKGPQAYTIIQYTDNTGLKNEEVQKIVNDLEKRHEQMRMSVQKMHEELQKDMHKVFQDFMDFDKSFSGLLFKNKK